MPTAHKYISQRLTLNYVDWGNHAAPPLVLVHGGRDHARSWDWVARELRGDYHVMALDNRGHGDSQWTNSGTYMVDEFVHDLAEFVHQKKLAPLTVIGHSLGGVIALRYAGIHPDNVIKLVAIEGLGLGRRAKSNENDPAPVRYRKWIEGMRDLATWEERRYATFEDALGRMREANRRLSAEKARHLTRHGTRRNDDGSLSWKFDHYFFTRFMAPVGLDTNETHELWANIACPTLLVRGADSWAADPEADGSAAHFRDVQCATIEGAGHWVHHDRLDQLMALIKPFLAK